MKEITHTGKHPEPIVLAIKSGKHTAYRNLLVGETQDIEEDQISSEIRHLEKRGHVVLKDKPETNKKLKSPPVPEPEKTEVSSTDEEMTPEELAALEEELLNEDGSDAVSNEEA